MKAWLRAVRAFAPRVGFLLLSATSFACNDNTMGSAGRIEVSVASTDVIGVDGYQVIVTSDMVPATDPRSIGLNGIILVEGLDAGVYLVSLAGVPSGCDGPNPSDPQGVTLEENGFARVEFVVVCPVPQS
jgi:hypothetical protein